MVNCVVHVWYGNEATDDGQRKDFLIEIMKLNGYDDWQCGKWQMNESHMKWKTEYRIWCRFRMVSNVDCTWLCECRLARERIFSAVVLSLSLSFHLDLLLFLQKHPFWFRCCLEWNPKSEGSKQQSDSYSVCTAYDVNAFWMLKIYFLSNNVFRIRGA